MITTFVLPKRTFELPQNRRNDYKNSFGFTGVKIWNVLPDSLKEDHPLKVLRLKSNHMLSAPTGFRDVRVKYELCNFNLVAF